AGFTGVVSVSRPDERVGKGKIANQIPAPGATLARGGQVQLALSLGPDDRPVPNVVGYPVAGALTLLERAGMGFTAQVEPSDQPSGTVLRTQPSAGEKRPKGTTVLLVLASGPAPVWDPDLLAALAPREDSWLQGLTGGEQAAAPAQTNPVGPAASGRPTVTLPPRPASPPTTRPPSSPPTTRPPSPPTTRPPSPQPSGPICYTYPPVDYWDAQHQMWMQEPGSTICA
ncbi:MAG: PASTA domain-containing protein, partial [Actinobacteria bacterium]|nr:PASTA domain-containing protein [Actinomycetota bacterium]